MSRKKNNNKDILKKEKVVGKDEKFDSAKFYIEYGIDVEKRKVMLDEDVDEYSVGWIIRGIHKMMDASRTDPIDIYINSYGGYCYDGLALIDTIQSCEYATIRTHAIGKIMSMGLMIYLAGDERYARPYATFMAHSVSSGTWGKLFEMNTEVKEVKRLQEILCDMFAENTKHDAKWWQRHTKYEDRYYDTEKAKELGIVSHDYDNFGKIKDED